MSGKKARKLCRSTVALTSLLWLSFVAQGRVIHVPKDYPTIHSGAAAAQDGDEVIVEPGVYQDPLTFDGKNIIVRSTFNGDWSIVRNTIIDGSSFGFGVGFRGNETTTCVLRGFTIISTMNGSVGIGGNGTHATIEYNIIHDINNYAVPAGYGNGAGISGCEGLIQNNILYGNEANYGAAFYNCNGTIQNNLVYDNAALAHANSGAAGGAFYHCNGTIRNNTLDKNFCGTFSGEKAGGLVHCRGTIVNNIIYSTMTLPMEYDDCSTPTYCIFRDPHAGVGNITGDPKFVNPGKGDYHLKSDSPGIDAGKRFSDVPADLDGHQRGLKSKAIVHGDGSAADIGAYETLPKPVAVWLPEGGPPGDIKEGQALSVSWALDSSAGITVHLWLRQGGSIIKNFGLFTNSTGAGKVTLTLPAALATRADYDIYATNVTTHYSSSSSATFKIFGSKQNAVASSSWLSYY